MSSTGNGSRYFINYAKQGCRRSLGCCIEPTAGTPPRTRRIDWQPRGSLRCS
jgi:hypothetical protein